MRSGERKNTFYQGVGLCGISTAFTITMDLGQVHNFFFLHSQDSSRFGGGFVEPLIKES